MAPSKSNTIGPLEHVLSLWARELVEDAVSPGYRLLRTLRGSWVSVICIMGHASLVLRDLARSESIDEVQVLLTLYIGAHSSLAAQLILWRRRNCIKMAVRLASHVARQLHLLSSDAKAMSAAGRLILLTKRFYASFATFTTISVAVSLFLEGPWRSSLLIFAKLAFMAFCTMCCVSAYYALLAFILGIHIACANLYKELGKQFQIDSGVAETTQLAMLHANLKETVQLLDEMLGWLYPHFLFAGTAMPLLCSAKVIISKGQTDSFALGTVPLILLVFITQCLVGQSLEDASRALPDSCYFGPWLQETSPKRKGRLLIMLLAHSHAVLRVRAFGKLNRPTCVNILKSWFSYLQVLLKFGS
ncbi:uncharacterized protein LOC113217281 isoform X2 [Frankliniella occidentalis]|uniref:Uncharacterized protein LOC113217281 isoform X2 n=1 Tax=Frankliniella occidentalis TaxID=133901 RepID=A0A9C6X7D5_FRAOC|nr:uncharacterized protein LOC113217281 isoform X2 [Frankliniella occidentalis]